MNCDRCKAEDIGAYTMSYFNTQTICNSCQDRERKHSLFAAARDRETKEVLKGNYNYSGVGLPADLEEDEGA